VPLVLERKWIHILDNYLLNAVEVYEAVRRQSELPPFRLRTGLTLRHMPGYDIWPEFIDVFFHRCYTQPCFYSASSSDTIIDIGAGVGTFALHLSGLARGIQIICFEPSRDIASFLRANINANGLDRVIVVDPDTASLRDLMATSDTHAVALTRVIGPRAELHKLIEDSGACWRNVRSLIARDPSLDNAAQWTGTMRRLLMLGFRHLDVARYDSGATILSATRSIN
jgi:precorrin-6B methylase 2